MSDGPGRPERAGFAPASIFAIGLLAASAWGCQPEPSPLRYRLADSGERWTVSGNDPVLEDVRTKYPHFFDELMNRDSSEEFNLKELRDDLERAPVDRRNYDALNALAIGYFELNYRAIARRGGPTYLANSFGSAKFLAVPWRAYGLISDGALRGAILDFFEDAASGEKLGSASTAPRLLEVVASLEPKERDSARRERIRWIAQRLAEADRDRGSP
jgi:hypothetical protein